jgi:putative ABC transport system substrate-binding protein
MRRRTFIATLAGAAVLPLSAHAQRSMPAVGFLHSGSSEHFAHLAAAFRQGLSDVGYVEGRNVTFEYRWADSLYDRLPTLAAELVNRKVSLIFVAGGPPSVLAVKNATQAIPVVFVSSDPLRFGIVKSLSRPEGNLTGVGNFTASLGSKRLELLRSIVPAAKVVGFLVNPAYSTIDEETNDMRAAVSTAGLDLAIVPASTEKDLEPAFAAMVQQRAQAVVVASDTAFTNWRRQIVRLAELHRIPVIHFQREFATDGGLMSYGNNLTNSYRQAGTYIDRILKGAKPSDLPIMQPTKFELVINIKTAKTLGLELHPQLLATADELIE